MKKSIYTIAILLSIFSVVLTSCNKDDDDILSQLGGEYHLVMDGNTVADGETEEIGMIGNAVSVSVGEDLGILVSGVPESVGDVAQLGGTATACSVAITGKNILDSGTSEIYLSISGTVKRTSASKITFEGTCSDISGTEVHTFSGFVESDAYKVL